MAFGTNFLPPYAATIKFSPPLRRYRGATVVNLEDVYPLLEEIRQDLARLKARFDRDKEKYSKGTVSEEDLVHFKTIETQINVKVKEINEILQEYQRIYNAKYKQSTLF
tara:strand:- start:466 stop:792 length:327 start_codon:yes stop_codon:yes gene_type:complete